MVTSMQRDLVIAARDGDLEAYSQLVRSAFPRLYGIAHLILRDADRAQDAVQDALVLACRHVRSLRDPDAWEAWLRRLTVHACYRAARMDKRRTVVEQHVHRNGGTTVAHDHAAELAERDWVVGKLGAIDLDQRTVLVLHYYLDLPMKDVAEILDIPYGTAASRLHRGLEALRASMRGPIEADRGSLARQAP
jgi:RNA polymerase sigma-70 factor (ECF subfamily)